MEGVGEGVLEGVAGAAEFEAFEVKAPLAEDLVESGFFEAEGGADLFLEADEGAVAAEGLLELGEGGADAIDQLAGTAEVDRQLAAVAAVDEAEVWPEFSAGVGSPGGNDGALAGKDVRGGFDEGQGGVDFLGNRRAFFRNRGPRIVCLAFGSGCGAGVGAVTRGGFWVVRDGWHGGNPGGLWVAVVGGEGIGYSPRFMVANRGGGFKGSFGPLRLRTVGKASRWHPAPA